MSKTNFFMVNCSLYKDGNSKPVHEFSLIDKVTIAQNNLKNTDFGTLCNLIKDAIILKRTMDNKIKNSFSVNEINALKATQLSVQHDLGWGKADRKTYKSNQLKDTLKLNDILEPSNKCSEEDKSKIEEKVGDGWYPLLEISLKYSEK